MQEASIKDRIVSLQILRFFAAVAVVVAHASCVARAKPGSLCSLYFPTEIGVAGVDVFFVLSGFIITFTGPLAIRRPSGGQFFWRRWSRVAPIYYLLSIPWVAQAAMTGRLNWPQTVGTFLFWPAAGPSLVTPYLVVGWTLSYEMIFYSTVSALLVGRRLRRNLAILALLLAALIALRQLTAWDPVRVVTSPYFLEFAAGAALAWLWPRLKTATMVLGIGLIVLGVLIFTLEAAYGAAHPAFALNGIDRTRVLSRVAMFGPPAAIIVAGACICDRAIRGGLARALAWMGDASYSTYLSHGLVVPILAYLWFATLGVSSPWLTTPVLIAASLVVGAATYVFIERPILKDLRRVRFGAAPLAAASLPGGSP
ncbi:MAG TPA: acyltransferase [Caulobacteraceae bacterium]